MHEGLGFAAKRFSEVLRVAWFPYLVLFVLNVWLILGVAPNLDWNNPSAGLTLAQLYFPVALIVNATVMVALTRMAFFGEQSHRRSIHFAFGPREVLFVLASLFSILVVGGLSLGPGLFVQHLIERFAEAREVETAFFFEEGSLHEGSENLLYADGHPIRSWAPVATIAAFVLLGYLALRMAMLPFFVAAGSASPVRSSLRASSGLNVVRLLLLLLVMVIIQYAADFSADFIASFGLAVGGLFGMAVYIAQSWGLDFATPAWADRGQLIIAFGVSAMFAIVIQSFTAGLLAGFAGAVGRQVEGNR